jgi:hypothetical protein
MPLYNRPGKRHRLRVDLNHGTTPDKAGERRFLLLPHQNLSPNKATTDAAVTPITMAIRHHKPDQSVFCCGAVR